MSRDRRDFLMTLGIGAGVAGIAAQAGASLRSLIPNVSYDAPTTVKLGLPAEFPDGLKFLPNERLFVFRTGNVYHAVSAVCTHLGCTVQLRPDGQSIWCACHNGLYDLEGRNVSGPPPRPLEAYVVHVIGGDVVVEKAKSA